MALNALGYSSTESLKAVSKVDITEDMDVEDVLKLALKIWADWKSCKLKTETGNKT